MCSGWRGLEELVGLWARARSFENRRSMFLIFEHTSTEIRSWGRLRKMGIFACDSG